MISTSTPIQRLSPEQLQQALAEAEADHQSFELIAAHLSAEFGTPVSADQLQELYASEASKVAA